MKKLIIVFLLIFCVGCKISKSDLIKKSFKQYPDCKVYTTMDNDNKAIVICDKSIIYVSEGFKENVIRSNYFREVLKIEYGGIGNETGN